MFRWDHHPLITLIFASSNINLLLPLRNKMITNIFVSHFLYHSSVNFLEGQERLNRNVDVKRWNAEENSAAALTITTESEQSLARREFLLLNFGRTSFSKAWSFSYTGFFLPRVPGSTTIFGILLSNPINAWPLVLHFHLSQSRSG